jgi:hypothetical protein
MKESWASHAWRNSQNIIAFREQSRKNAYLGFNPESTVVYVNVEEHEFNWSRSYCMKALAYS